MIHFLWAYEHESWHIYFSLYTVPTECHTLLPMFYAAVDTTLVEVLTLALEPLLDFGDEPAIIRKLPDFQK